MYDEGVLGDVFEGAATGLNAEVDSSLVLPESDSLPQDGGLCLVKLKCSIAFKRSWLHLKKITWANHFKENSTNLLSTSSNTARFLFGNSFPNISMEAGLTVTSSLGPGGRVVFSKLGGGSSEESVSGDVTCIP